MRDIHELYRLIPNMTRILARTDIEDIPGAHAKRAAESVLADIRARIAGGDITDESGIEHALTDIRGRAESFMTASLTPAVNATGVIIHTNLGRSPLAGEAIDEISRIAASYTTLEYDRETGGRGERYHHAADMLKQLTGAEDAVVVNNNAAAVFLILNTLAKARQVIVSRGELVEIGGSFRIPDVMREAGATLTEIGTTNKTRKTDYTDAVEPDTALMMKVHRSNYEIIGFTADVPPVEIPALAASAGVLSYYDAGSGLVMTETDPSRREPSLARLMKAGYDLVSASGDKLLGGPQAGIIIGKKSLVDQLKKNPLIRMLRVDKLTLAALQATLRLYIEGRMDEIPTYAMITAPVEALSAKADALARMIGEDVPDGVIVTTSFDESSIGGGSSATGTLPTRIVSVMMPGVAPEILEQRLRTGSPPVICRIRDEAVLFDVRTVFDTELPPLAAAVRRALKEGS